MATVCSGVTAAVIRKETLYTRHVEEMVLRETDNLLVCDTVAGVVDTTEELSIFYLSGL